MGHQMPTTENAVLTIGASRLREAAHLEELGTLFRTVEPGLGSHVQRRKGTLDGLLPYRYRKWNFAHCLLG
jgi:hypothetical protein